MGRVHLHDRVPRDVARRRAVRHQLHGVADDEFRPDVEGLRALAVVAVVLFHLRLGLFQGGFVGVDVFFVLSGFLITRLLLKELASTGTLSLPGFWARRARRLLPASSLVVVVTLLAGTVALSPLAQRTLAVDAMAAGVFVVNFVFAGRFGDYFAAQLAAAQPSALLHYWSLAVEEQFYLLWPVLLVALTRRPRRYRRLLIATILVIAVASLITSIWMTEHRPTWAFYLLPVAHGRVARRCGHRRSRAGVPCRQTRAAGSTRVVWRRRDLRRGDVLRRRNGVSRLHDDVARPGDGARDRCRRQRRVGARGPVAVLRHPLALWIGRHSYAIYLWHWPVLVLVEAEYGPQPLPTRLALVAIAVGLSAASLRLVEDPVRHSPWLAQRAGRGLALGGTLSATVVLAGAWMRSATPRSTRASRRPRRRWRLRRPRRRPWQPSSPALPAAPSPPAESLIALPEGDVQSLVTANRAVLEQGLTQTDVPSNLRPALRDVGADRAEVYGDDCVAVGRVSELSPCRYGADGSAFTVVLYGDSHAAQWFPTLLAIAEERQFELVVMIKGGCPTAAVSIPTATLARTCPIWRDQAIAWIAAEQPELVLVSAWAGYPNEDDEWGEGFAATMQRVVPNARNVVVIGDTPAASDEPVDCLSRNLRRADVCSSTRDNVVASSRLAVEQDIAADVGAAYIDTSDWLCTDTGCPMMIGDILLYRDATHLTTVASEWFQPLLEASLAPVLRSGPAVWRSVQSSLSMASLAASAPWSTLPSCWSGTLSLITSAPWSTPAFT